MILPCLFSLLSRKCPASGFSSGSARRSVPAACDREAANGLSELCAVLGALWFRAESAQPWRRTDILVDRRPAGVFSGGGRTDSVEAFAGAQGQRVNHGFEATAGKRDPELVERGARCRGRKVNERIMAPLCDVGRSAQRPVSARCGAHRKRCPPQLVLRSFLAKEDRLPRHEP